MNGLKKLFSALYAVLLCVMILLCTGSGIIDRVSPAAQSVTPTPVTTETETAETETADTVSAEPETKEQEPVDDSVPDETDANGDPLPYTDAWMAWFQTKLEELKTEFPDGYYWNHVGHPKGWLGVTNKPCNHRKKGSTTCNIYTCASTNACGWKRGLQCAGFAGLLSDKVFGTDAPVTVFYNYDAIRPGDQARINGDMHTVFILEKTDEYVIVAECNAGGMNDCKIAWGRKIPRGEMGGYYLTRVS